MNRVAKLIVAVLVLVGCLIFASALFGGLMDEAAFTPQPRKRGTEVLLQGEGIHRSAFARASG
ncbi:MAG: hypothetical protein HZY74_01590 [Brevundimonas sp.]|nr:MAG: hypothetical protein HZY74_01590 [Brevundimonas sp.]